MKCGGNIYFVRGVGKITNYLEDKLFNNGVWGVPIWSLGLLNHGGSLMGPYKHGKVFDRCEM